MTRRRRRWLFRAVYVVYVLLLATMAYRACLWLMFSVPPTDFTNTVDPYRRHYRELFSRQILQTRRGPDELQVLLLGGSVAEQVADTLQDVLTDQTSQSVRVHSAAMSAHTTRDSLNKLSWLTESEAEFDLIIVYHGINDVRMNCIQPQHFREDYSHCRWYRAFEKLKSGGPSVRDVARETWEQAINLGPPDVEKLALGGEIKTAPSFRAHLQQMVALANAADTPLVLMTFGTHYVEHYTRAAMNAGELGYSDGRYKLAMELWGTPQNVRRTIAVHNRVVTEVATQYPDVIFIDMASELIDISDFSDICHLSPGGVDHFVQVLTTAVKGKWPKPAK